MCVECRSCHGDEREMQLTEIQYLCTQTWEQINGRLEKISSEQFAMNGEMCAVQSNIQIA